MNNSNAYLQRFKYTKKGNIILGFKIKFNVGCGWKWIGKISDL